LLQVRNYCAYHDQPLEMNNEHFDRVVRSYFTALSGMGDVPVAAAPPAEAADNYGVTKRLDGQ
jgi:hypothetical protein